MNPYRSTIISRSILIFEQSPAVVLIALTAVIHGSGSPAKTRGAVCIGIGFLALLLMDSDASVEQNHC